MRLPLITLLASLTAVLAAPPAIQARAPSCNIAVDACSYSCAGGSGSLNCYGSYCKASGNAGPYGTCVCKCKYG